MKFKAALTKCISETPGFFLWQGASFFYSGDKPVTGHSHCKKSKRRCPNGINRRLLDSRFFCAVLLALALAPVFCGAARAGDAKDPPPAAQITIEAPPAAAVGEAFLARAFSTAPLESFRFIWMKKSVSVPAMRYGSIWFCEILLPAALGSPAKNEELRVSGGGGESVAVVELYEIDRPVQKLKVDPKFVNPPKQMAARIERDKKLVAETLGRVSSLRHWTLPLARPADGNFSSPFGVRRMYNGETRGWHRGLDFRGGVGAPVRAAADGVVALVEDLYFSGNSIYIDHGLGFLTAYIHLSAIEVARGQTVARGQVIGKIGATGRVTGPHLHFTMFALGAAVDPKPFLENARE